MRTYDAGQVANYLLAIADPEDSDISNLKLQKLCYYAQGLCGAMRGTPLFFDRIEAWDHGPVVISLYHSWKHCGSGKLPLPITFDASQIDETDRRALDDIYAYYAQFSAWKLRNMTHDEIPWKEAYQRLDRTISFCELMKFFGPQIDPDYTRRIYGNANQEVLSFGVVQ